MRFFLKIAVLLLIANALFSGNTHACHNGDPSEKKAEMVTPSGYDLFLTFEDSEDPVQSCGMDDCCSICKVYNMFVNAYPCPPYINFIVDNYYLFQDGACKNANSGRWQPPKCA